MKNVVIVSLGCAFICLCTLFSIDLSIGSIDIPITGQSFAVTLVGYVLYHRLGAIAAILYIILGCLGLPIFADGGSGYQSLLGNSGGYLYGFIPAAYMCGYLHTKGWTSFPMIVLAMSIGTVIILAIGVTHLSIKIGLENGLKYGLYPFVAGALIKIVLASVAAFLMNKYFYKK